MHVEKSANATILPTFIDEADLEFLLSCFHRNIGYEILNTNKIKFINVTKDISYIGYTNEND